MTPAGSAGRRGRRERSLCRCRRGTCLPERKGSRAFRHRRRSRPSTASFASGGAPVLAAGDARWAEPARTAAADQLSYIRGGIPRTSCSPQADRLRRRLRQLRLALSDEEDAPTPYLGRPLRGVAWLDISRQSTGTPSTCSSSAAGDLAGGSGSVVIEWDCFEPHHARESTATSTRASRAARPERQSDGPDGPTVRSPVRPCASRYRRSRVGRSARRAFRPTHRSSTPRRPARRGTFAWDVAPGRWRLRVTAYGYRSFVSKTYKVPPAVTGLQLQLTPDPRTQRLLIDPAGHVGAVQLRGKLGRRVAGLRIVLAGHRVRTITVTSKRFRTALAIRLGSTEADLQRAYPNSSRRRRSSGRRPRGPTASSTRRSPFATAAWPRSSCRSA